MATRDVMAIDIGRHRVRGLHATMSGRRLTVKRTFDQPVPQNIRERNEPAAVGEWLGAQLRSAGFPSSGAAVVSLERAQVGLKRLKLPTTDQHEVPGMTRLAMQRDLPFDADDAVIDFVVSEQTASHTVVLAVAVPSHTIEAARTTVKAAGYAPSRITLRQLGLAALMDDGGESPAASLAVDLTGDAIEFLITNGSSITFSRAASLSTLAAAPTLREAVATETRRTWMSYRMIDDASDLRRVLLAGTSQDVEDVSQVVTDVLSVQPQAFAAHPCIDAAAHDMSRVRPLAGLLLMPVLGLPDLNFLRPRREQDRAARPRQIALAIASLILILLVGGWVFARHDLASLRAEHAALASRVRSLQPQYLRYNRDGYLLRHVEHWAGVDVAWLDHLQHLAAVMPSRERIVLDEWSGTLKFAGVEHDRNNNAWSAPFEISIVVEGESIDRQTANDFRGALVASSTYKTSSSGADAQGGRRLPQDFSYLLTSRMARPLDVDPPAQTTTAGASEAATLEGGR